MDADLFKLELPTAVRLHLEAARDLGFAARMLDAEFNYLFELSKGDLRRVFLGGRSPLNDAVAARLAEDKHYTELLLREAGIPVVHSRRCLAPRDHRNAQYRARAGMAPALEAASTWGYPLVVKPNRLSHARGVCRVLNEASLCEAVEVAWSLDSVALVQECVEGRDLRLDFLDGEFLVGYERRPIVVQGDGKRSLRQLVAAVDARMADDAFWKGAMASQAWKPFQQRGLTEDSVLAQGEVLELASVIRNLNAFSTCDVLTEIPESWARIGREAGRTLGLRHWGVDLKLSEERAEPRMTVIEVNASPLLNQIYLMGHRQQALEAQQRVLRAVFEVEGFTRA